MLLSYPRPSRFSPLSSRSFTFWHFTFRSLTYVELMLVTCVRPMLTFDFFFLFACKCPLVQTLFVERPSLFHCVAFSSLSMMSSLCGSISDLLIVLHSYICPVSYCFDYYSYIVILEVGWHQSSTFVFSHSILN